NVNGIRAAIKRGSLQEFVTAHQPDIFCLQETKAKAGQAKPDLPGYLEYWHSAVKPGYSGTAIFANTEPLHVLEGLPPEIEQQFDLANDPYGNPNLEGRVLAAELPEFWLVTVYTPNSKGNLSRLDLRYRAW